MEYVRTFDVGKAEIKVTLSSIGFRLWRRLDNETSEMFFDKGGRRGTDLRLGDIKDLVCWQAVKASQDGRKRVRFSHPQHKGGEEVSITLGDPATFENFPEIDSDVDYMAGLPEAFTRQVLLTFPALYQRYRILWMGILNDEDEDKMGGQAEEDPTEPEVDSQDEEDTSTSEPSSTGVPSNAL